jgi:hypothetical protein
VVLVEADKLDTPASVSDLSVNQPGSDTILTWTGISTDTGGGRELVTHYSIYRGSEPDFTPDDGDNKIDDVYPPTFGSTDNTFTYTDSGMMSEADNYYIVRSYGASGSSNDSNPESPTAVSVSSFKASATFGQVSLFWQTASEIDILGFNIYRSTAMDGEKHLLNAELFPSKAMGSLTGESYLYVDQEVEPGETYYYWLEPVSISGGNELYGSLQITVLYGLYIPIIVH